MTLNDAQLQKILEMPTELSWESDRSWFNDKVLPLCEIKMQHLLSDVEQGQYRTICANIEKYVGSMAKYTNVSNKEYYKKLREALRSVLEMLNILTKQKNDFKDVKYYLQQDIHAIDMPWIKQCMNKHIEVALETIQRLRRAA